MQTKLKALPSLERLNDLLRYDPDLGDIFWKVQRKGRGKIGERAGGVSPHGYRVVVIDVSNFMVHRIIWKMHFEKEPQVHVDHIDGNPLNNYISNLRLASVSQNLCNSKLRSDSTSGIKGVYYSPESKRNKPWRAVLMKDHKYIQVGRFSSREEAINRIDTVRIRLHGEFARKS